jgi:hypothetical protein
MLLSFPSISIIAIVSPEPVVVPVVKVISVPFASPVLLASPVDFLSDVPLARLAELDTTSLAPTEILAAAVKFAPESFINVHATISPAKGIYALAPVCPEPCWAIVITAL